MAIPLERSDRLSIYILFGISNSFADLISNDWIPGSISKLLPNSYDNVWNRLRVLSRFALCKSREIERENSIVPATGILQYLDKFLLWNGEKIHSSTFSIWLNFSHPIRRSLLPLHVFYFHFKRANYPVYKLNRQIKQNQRVTSNV